MAISDRSSSISLGASLSSDLSISSAYAPTAPDVLTKEQRAAPFAAAVEQIRGDARDAALPQAKSSTGGSVWGVPRPMAWVDGGSSVPPSSPAPVSVFTETSSSPACEDAAPAAGKKAAAAAGGIPLSEAILVITVIVALMTGVMVLFDHARASVLVNDSKAVAAENWQKAQETLPGIVWKQVQMAEAGLLPTATTMSVPGRDFSSQSETDVPTAPLLVSVAGHPVTRYADGTTSIKVDVAYPDAAVASIDVIRDDRWFERPESYRAGARRLADSENGLTSMLKNAAPSCVLVDAINREGASAKPASEAQAHPHVTVSLVYPKGCPISTERIPS